MTEERLLELAVLAQDQPDVIRGMISSEPGAKYHAFVALVVKDMESSRFVELGVYKGETSKYVALLNRKTQVIGLDNEASAIKKLLKVRPKLKNIKGVLANATSQPPAEYASIDVLFLDVNHDFSTTMSAFVMWEPLVRSGGVILIDDIDLDKQTELFNHWLEDRGYRLIRLPNLHATGFGAIIKA